MLHRKSSVPISRGLGNGLYTVADVARLLHVKPGVVCRWSRVVAESQTPLRQRADGRRDPSVAWSFLDLINLLFVERFVAAGLSMREVTLLDRDAAARIGLRHPFSTRRFKTLVSGARAARRRNGSSHAPDDLRYLFAAHGDLVARTLLPLFEKLDFNDSAYVVRYWPLGRDERVVLDPNRNFGRPIDAPTRVPTEALYDAVRAGGGQDRQLVADWFDVPVEAVHAAVRFEQDLRGM